MWHKATRLVTLLAGLVLASCDRQGASDALLVDYQRRLAEALATAPPSPASPDNIPAFPAPDERLFEIPETREGFLAVHALRRCHITTLVAQRNSALGRVAPPSQRWHYELELWRRLAACRDSEVAEALDESDRARLERLAAIKGEQLARVSWNALLGSSEWVGNFSRASRPLTPGGVDDLAPYLAALDYLETATRNQFNPDWRLDTATLEGHLQTLQESPLSARLLRTLMLANQRLAETNALLATRLRQGAACERRDTLRRVDEEQLTARVRPFLATLATQAETWFGALGRLYDAHEVARAPIRDYHRRWFSLEAPATPWAEFQAALAHHRALWARLREACGLDQGA